MARQNFFVGTRCLRCGKEYAIGECEYVCSCRPNLGSDLGTLDAEYDYEAIARHISPVDVLRDPDRSIGRYAFIMPVADRSDLPPLPVGNTPLLHGRRLSDTVGLRALLIKDEGRNPSASLKDRASAIAVARSMEAHIPVIAAASTGNAAAALAGQCAAAGQPSVIFVPRTAPTAKIAQLLVYGSTVLAIDGTYDEAFDLCTQACREFGWYNRNTGFNPFMTEGKKTVAYEIAEQLANIGASFGASNPSTKSTLESPDAVFVSVGDGSIIGGVYKGFLEFLKLEWLDKIPRIYGVQSTRSAALHDAWRDDLEVPHPVHAHTRADSINVNAPRDAVKALRAVRESGGAFVLVTDEAIMDAILPLARLGGVFAEPAGAASLAGLSQAVALGLVERDESVVVINTGNGMKDINAAIEVAGQVHPVEPTMKAVRKAIDGLMSGK